MFRTLRKTGKFVMKKKEEEEEEVKENKITIY